MNSTAMTRFSICGALLLLSIALTPAAMAGTKSLGKVKSSDFVVKQDGFDCQMRIKDIGDDDEGYIDYTLATAPNGESIIQIDGIKGVKDIKGVGEALKKEVLRRYPNREIRSQLVNVNGTKLLSEWANGFPHSSSDKNGESLRNKVPALKIEGFDYEITAEPTRTGGAGSIFLVMRAAKSGKGKINIANPEDLDKVLLSSPQRKEISASKLAQAEAGNEDSDGNKEELAESEKAAKAAGAYIAKLAKDKSKKQKFSSDDLVKHLWESMDSSCGRGGGNGSSWSKGCIFTKKGSSYLVQPRKGNSSSRFTLDDEMEDLVKAFTKKHG